MGIFRNEEIKKQTAIIGALSAAGTIVGFVISIYAGILVIALSICFFAVMVRFNKKRYDDVKQLTKSLNEVLHGNSAAVMDECAEGELQVLRDEIKKMALALQHSAEKLETEKSCLADSLSDISHQLKTPLTSMNLIMTILRNPNCDEEERIRLMREMSNLLLRMEWLISSLLKLSKLDSGNVQFVNDEVQVSRLIDLAASPLEIPMELKNISLSTEGDSSVSAFVDKAWTAEAFGNILKNCMEHTPENGEIRIKVEESPIAITIVIEDSGTGIDEVDLPHIFERFYRGKDDENSAGVGIGLALARMIITKQDGTIKAENMKRGGCRFVVKFYKAVV